MFFRNFLFLVLRNFRWLSFVFPVRACAWRSDPYLSDVVLLNDVEVVLESTGDSPARQLRAIANIIEKRRARGRRSPAVVRLQPVGVEEL